jgi:hypothetical protein
MKTHIRIFVMLLLPAALLSCKDKITETYMVNEPVYMSYDELRNPIKTVGEQKIRQPGKIYFKDHYIFINEYEKGIHVIDNSDPSSPEIIRFIEIPGNIDLAIKDTILYADSYVDLVAIDISNMDNIREVKRITDAFPYLIPACEDGVIESVDMNKGVVTSWKETERVVNIDEIDDHYDLYPVYNDDFRVVAEYNSAADKGGAAGTGTGGSLARFTVYDNYLYAVDDYMLRMFDVSTPEEPKFAKEMYVGWNIETLFPYDGKLFLGGKTGLYIYSLENPENPVYLSSFWHASSCDPVVVENNLAYVTLRAGNLCGDDVSQLDVIDISNILSPKLLKEYPMEEPYGLGIDENILFVCDGDAGLKVYNAVHPLEIDKNMIALYEDINAWDVIPIDGVLMMIGSDGLYQYDYTDPSDISELSMIPVGSTGD